MAIAISKKYPHYWELDGVTTLLLGGSREDNLFQIPDLEEHLQLLAASGGNYIRCTMSSRDPGDMWPFEQNGDGLYDLNAPSAGYWRRFDTCMRLCHGLRIVAQIEVWDRFDFSREPWRDNPYNPANNCNYTAGQIGMVDEYPEHPGKNLQPFFFSVPELRNNTLLLRHQQAFVDELLKHSLPFNDVLYCMDNETSAEEAWGAYWARYIQDTARKAGRIVFTTEMWDNWDITSEEHRRSIDHPEIYQFLDSSQNNQTQGQANWDNMQAIRAHLNDAPRPINNVKIYGSPARIHKDEVHAQQCFWRALFGGAAAARFHRPPTGLGLNDVARAHIRSMRMLQSCFSDWFAGQPHNDLIASPSDNSAFCYAAAGQAIAVVFFTDQPRTLDLSSMGGTVSVRWLDVLQSAWGPHAVVTGTTMLLRPPGEMFWVAMVSKNAP